MVYGKILIVQTAFIGDVILATSLIEKLNRYFPEASIDFLLRKGNEGLLRNHPKLREVHIWDKKGGKYKNLLVLIKRIRAEKYDLVVNVQRFANSGFLTARSGAKEKIGFDKNPFAWAFTKKVSHKIGHGIHEVQRNNELIKHITDDQLQRPVLYPSQESFDKVAIYKKEPFLVMAPASVWFTKQFPKSQWIKLIQSLQFKGTIYLIGAPNDRPLCDEIIKESRASNVENLCGQLNLLESAALMKDAVMNYVNDSAPMHLASAMNAKTAAIYCSTVPEFGFGPLAEGARVIEVEEKLDCRPCGLHGYKDCPKGHFKCARDIKVEQLLLSH